MERQTGSAKFGSYAAVVTGMSYALQLVLGGVLQQKAPWTPGPLPLVFASFIPFLLDIPATSDFTVLGCKMTDKVSCTPDSVRASRQANAQLVCVGGGLGGEKAEVK